MSYGHGSISQLPSGSWRAEIRVAGERLRQTCATKREARAWLSSMIEARARLERGEQRQLRGSRPDVTYGELAPEVLVWLERGGKRRTPPAPNTKRGYLRDLRAVLRWGAERKVAATTEADLDELVGRWHTEGRSTSTIRQRLDRLSQLHEYAVRRGYLVREPCRVERPELVIAAPRRPAPHPVEHYIEQTDDPRAQLVIALAGWAGLRRAEPALLHGEHVTIGPARADDHALGWLRVEPHSEHERTKSGRGRWVPILCAPLLAMLESWPREPGARLLPSPRTPTGISRMIERELGHSPLHALRHRWVTLLEERGVPRALVAAWAGHADIRTTGGYSHAGESVPASALADNIPHEPPTREGSGRSTATRK